MIQTGIVKWFNANKGYGFIKLDNEKQDVSAVKVTVIGNQKRKYQIIEEK